MIQRGHHDMGGQPAGKVERDGLDATHDYAEWERRVDALAVLLQGIKKGTKRQVTVDERRKAIEMLPPQEYDRMSYYERWIVSLTQALIQRGVITSDELGRKIEQVRSRG